MRTNKGFTFIEMLLVLTIILMILLVTTQFGYRQWTIHESDLYMEQLLKDIQYVQSLAERTHLPSSIVFVPKNNQLYYDVYNGNVVVKELALPKQITLITSGMNKLYFNGNGAASESKQIRFQADQKKYRIIVYIGEGVPKLETY